MSSPLGDGRFVAVSCGRFPDPERPSFCRLWFDWRPDARLQVSFLRVRMPEWREMAPGHFVACHRAGEFAAAYGSPGAAVSLQRTMAGR